METQETNPSHSVVTAIPAATCISLGKRKPARSGRTYMFVIPATFIKSEIVDPAKTYKVYLEEVEGPDTTSSPATE